MPSPSPSATLVFSHFLSRLLAGAGLVPESTFLIRVRVLHQTINLPPFMIFGEILSNRNAFGIHKQQTMAVLVDLHLVAGADPAAQFCFSLLIWIKVTRAERLAYLF